MTPTKSYRSVLSRTMVLLGFLVVALMAAGLMLLAANKPAHAQATFTVNSTSDPGGNGCNSTECTLREAITAANRTSSADVINFNIVGGTAPVKTISVTSELPTITGPVTIDGYSQPGASPNTLAKGTNANLLVELDGTNVPENSRTKLAIRTSNVVVRGLVINRFDAGIRIFSTDGPTDNNRIEGNFIGTDPSGTQALSAGGVVISGFDGQNNNILGGISPEARNLISGNDFASVIIGNASGTKVMGNLIGTKNDGTTPLGNADRGVAILDSERTIVGGTTPGAANTIAFNEEEGVFVSDLSSGSRILGNSIFSNGGLGIDLSELSNVGDGPTPNDPGDVDTGSNGLQNKPAIASATNSGGKTIIKGKINSKPNTPFTVQFFANTLGNEGKRSIGQKKVTTGSDGKAAFTFSPTTAVGVGKTVTATATSPEGTSEFSAPRTVTTS